MITKTLAEELWGLFDQQLKREENIVKHVYKIRGRVTKKVKDNLKKKGIDYDKCIVIQQGKTKGLRKKVFSILREYLLSEEELDRMLTWPQLSLKPSVSLPLPKRRDSTKLKALVIKDCENETYSSTSKRQLSGRGPNRGTCSEKELEKQMEAKP